ncbi:hypothetical protein B7463_g9095, partial [Scytalidium lignicola]
MATETPPSSPGVQSSKRKRDLQPSTPMKQLKVTPKKAIATSRSISPEDVTVIGSPRTKVARQLQELQLEEQEEDAEGLELACSPTNSHGFSNGRSFVTSPSQDKGAEVIQPETLPAEGSSRRSETDLTKPALEIPETPQIFKIGINQEKKNAPGASLESDEPVVFEGIKEKKNVASGGKRLLVLPRRTKNETTTFTSVSPLQLDSSNTKPLASKPRSSNSRKRTGSPPPSRLNSSEHPIVDPERASQTWQEEEITGYTVSDPDDDGEGINGVGFRPTAAMAYARAEKRRTQVMEYKNREAREARARRSERRREGGVVKKVMMNEVDGQGDEGDDGRRKVRFQDAETKMIEIP